MVQKKNRLILLARCCHTQHNTTHSTQHSNMMATTSQDTSSHTNREVNESDDNNDGKDDNDISYSGDYVPDLFMPTTRDIMNRAPWKDSSTMSMEACFFHKTFGTRLIIVEILWDLLDYHGLQPEDSRPKHLLCWALHFMKAYPLQAMGCETVDGSGGAVDAKTYQK